MELLILEIAQKYPIILSIAAFMGMARMILKPLMTFLHEVVLVTPSPKDDEILKKVEESRIYKGIIWFLDYVVSLKLKK